MMDRLRLWMTGRNGTDALCIATVGLAAGLEFVSLLTDWEIFSLLGSIALVWALYRFLSRDLYRRRAENLRFTRLGTELRERFEDWRVRASQSREYRFFVCPGCKNRLRVPRGKGKVQVTCPRCGERFNGHT